MLVMSHSSSELVSPSFQEGMAAVELPQRKSPPASKSREESESESREEFDHVHCNTAIHLS